MGQFFNLEEIKSFSPFNKQEHYNGCYEYCDAQCNIDYSKPYSEHSETWRNCRLLGLPDLNQENPYVRRKLFEIVQAQIDDFGFDGVRVDAAIHVPLQFLMELTANLTVPT